MVLFHFTFESSRKAKNAPKQHIQLFTYINITFFKVFYFLNSLIVFHLSFI